MYVPVAGRSVRPPDLPGAQRGLAADGRSRSARAQRRGPGEVVLLVLLAVGLALVIQTFLIQAFFIPSGSMAPTLEIGDRVLVEKVTYRFRDPRRGEIVVFRRPGAEWNEGIGGALRNLLQGLGLAEPDAEIDLIKRIIGLPGETVAIRDGVVQIDGAPLTEPYARVDTRDYGPVTVPGGQYFMLGDNRPNSDDSRFGIGTVPEENLIGRAFLILWPPGNVSLGLSASYPASLQSGGCPRPCTPQPSTASATSS